MQKFLIEGCDKQGANLILSLVRYGYGGFSFLGHARKRNYESKSHNK